MFPVLCLPITATGLLFSMYDFRDRINLSLACARAKRVLRSMTPANAMMRLRVGIRHDVLNNYVEMSAINEQGESVGRWTFYKLARDITTDQIIGDTYVIIDLAPHNNERSPLTNIQTFHILRSAAAFIDHFQYIYPNLIVDVYFDDLESLDLENMPSIHRWITRARKVGFYKCKIPEHEMLTIKALFKPHHRLVLKDCQIKFSRRFSVKSIKLHTNEYLEDYVAKHFDLFQCEKFEHGGYFSSDNILRILRTWKNGKNPLLKMIKVNCDEGPKKICSALNAKQWVEPGPRIFEWGDFEHDCTGGWDMRGPKNVIGTLNFREFSRHHQLLFVVWN